MNQRLVERVKKNKAEWELIGLIRRDMIVSYRVRWGRVVVDKARVVYVRRWESKVMCVPYKRKNGRVYYLACTDTKLSAEKVDNGYRKGVEIELVTSVMKQEMGLSKRIVRSKEGLMSWLGMSMIGYLMLVGRIGEYRCRRDEVKSEIEFYLCDYFALQRKGFDFADGCLSFVRFTFMPSGRG